MPTARSSATNRLIEAKDKASIQINIGHVNRTPPQPVAQRNALSGATAATLSCIHPSSRAPRARPQPTAYTQASSPRWRCAASSGRWARATAAWIACGQSATRSRRVRSRPAAHRMLIECRRERQRRQMCPAAHSWRDCGRAHARGGVRWLSVTSPSCTSSCSSDTVTGVLTPQASFPMSPSSPPALSPLRPEARCYSNLLYRL